ncbi:RNA helicase [Bifidobacterium sp. DSM 109960]|uniref:RNA helicase n=1 Tax=Bifidobacterium erythrocebi TaxID=2675325 RepID=A0A7Y0ET65_9BIFI|nr:DUF3427 domain-containing protein [Bifidobacterium sp. DSM 109960]NMM95934.1 RNA helicase [Bifidobacterium sp. DSM 109960]
MHSDSELAPSDSLLEDVTSGLVAGNADAPGTFSPRLISNQYHDTMGTALSNELQYSDSFDMSVAFVSSEALKSLFQPFLDHCRHSGTSRLITSTKNMWNNPKAFWELLRIKNEAHVDVRIWEGHDQNPNNRAFHPKGYVFARHMSDGKPYFNVYVGSSNLTPPALVSQREWNLRVSSSENGTLIGQFRDEISSQIDESIPLTEDWIKRYEEEFSKYEDDFRKSAPPRKELLESVARQTIEPNRMQREALANLRKLRDKGEHRAIVISATGTGKTYLSAFDVKQFRPKRMLYIAHREEILIKARESYRKVLGCDESELGILSGNSKQGDRKYVFAMVNTLSNPETLAAFGKEHFDYILIDEAHHVSAESYRRIVDYFTPDFMLGMTATPERTDGVNIFEMFGYNVAYEIRLQQALDEDMLCPFHYYGIAEYLGMADGDRSPESIQVNGDLTSGQRDQLTYEIGQLADARRVDYIIDQLRRYTPYDQDLTGLVFCSRQEEAERLSDLFNERYYEREERNYRTRAVTGRNSEEERRQAVKDLEENRLDYIFTVDLFNEGFDVPAINQIVMLRNTESSIVFTQQLGRGLRKFAHKSSVTVIDFIGNYANNFLIPIALYGRKGNPHKNIAARNSIGFSSISFDPISRERILNALDTADWSNMKQLSEEYRQIRFQIGRIPMLTDVYAHDPSLPGTLALRRSSKSGGILTASYLEFVRACERSLTGKRSGGSQTFADMLEPTSPVEDGILKMATELLLPGIRPHELVVLDALCRFGDERLDHLMHWEPAPSMDEQTLRRSIRSEFAMADDADEQWESALRVLDYSYFTKQNASRFGGVPLISRSNGRISLSEPFVDLLKSNGTFRVFFADTLRTGLLNCHDLFGDAQDQQLAFDHGFLYGHRYTLTDIERLCGWRSEVNGQNVGGYLCHTETGTMPILVKYEASQYEDRFLNTQEMDWYSKNNRLPTSPEFVWLRKDAGTSQWDDTHFVPLFVMRKQEEADKKYYYLGHVASVSHMRAVRKPGADGTSSVNVVLSTLHLAKPLDPEFYKYLTGRIA